MKIHLAEAQQNAARPENVPKNPKRAKQINLSDVMELNFIFWL
jgi:hypothetical protein